MWSRRAKISRDDDENLVVLAVEGMHCGSCGLTIDEAIEDVPGVARATTSFRSGLSEVLLADGADRNVVVTKVIDAISQAGYRAGARSS